MTESDKPNANYSLQELLRKIRGESGVDVKSAIKEFIENRKAAGQFTEENLDELFDKLPDASRDLEATRDLLKALGEERYKQRNPVRK